MKNIAVSGGFVIMHIGHIQMLQEAAKYGEVIVILNSDDWQKRKYGKVIVPWEIRRNILMEMRSVCMVVLAQDDDGTVCETLAEIKPDYFANGGDRTQENTPEKEICEKLNIEMLWGVGGRKIGSSSELMNAGRP